MQSPAPAREFPIRFPRAHLLAVDLSEIARLDQLPAIDAKPYRVNAHTRRVTRPGLFDRLMNDPFEIPVFLHHQAD